MPFYPWGPHGPTSENPNEIPNPTPPWKHAPLTPPSFETPGGAPASGPMPAGSGSIASGSTGRAHKSVFLAFLLALLFGPLGLFYASWKGALFLLFAAPPLMVALAWAAGSPSYLQYVETVGPIVYALSLVWSVIAARAFNRRHQ